MKALLKTALVVAFAITINACTETKKPQLTEGEINALLQLKDEMEIRALADKFSDAANRKDGELFQSLWASNGVWKIGNPINVEFKGKENMGASVTRMLKLWDFFVQITGPGVITVNGEKATARFYVNEVARKTDDKKGNYNLSMYEDELVKVEGKWLFAKRTYHTIYQEAPNYNGLIQELPKFN